MNDWEENPDAYMQDDRGSSYLKRMEHLAKKLADRKVRQVEATTTTQKLKPRLTQEKQYERKKSG